MQRWPGKSEQNRGGGGKNSWHVVLAAFRCNNLCRATYFAACAKSRRNGGIFCRFDDNASAASIIRDVGRARRLIGGVRLGIVAGI